MNFHPTSVKNTEICIYHFINADMENTKVRMTLSQGFNSDTVWVDSLWKLSQILYESVIDSLTDGHGFFTVLGDRLKRNGNGNYGHI